MKKSLIFFLLVVCLTLLSVCFALPSFVVSGESENFQIDVYDLAGNKVTPTVTTNDLGQTIFEVPYGTGYAFKVSASNPDIQVDLSTLTITRNDPTPSVVLQKNEYVESVYYKDGEVCHYQFTVKFSYTQNGKKSTTILPLNFKITPLVVGVQFSSLEIEYGSGKTIVGIIDKPATVQTPDVLAFRYYKTKEDYALGNSIEFPTEVGDYFVESYIQNENPNVKISEDAKLTPFKIIQSTATISAIDKAVEFTGNPFDLPTLMQANSTAKGLKFSLYEGEERKPVDKAFEVGEYYIYFVYDNAASFVQAEFGPYKLTVKKANISISANKVDYQLNYQTPTDFVPSFTIFNGDGVACNKTAFETSVNYYTSSGQKILFEDIQSAGEYAYSVSTLETDNYTACESEKTGFNFSIKKIDIENGILINHDGEVVEFLFNGNPFTIGTSTDDDVVFSVDEIFDDSAIIDCDINGGKTFEVTEPNEYHVTLTIEDESRKATKSFTIIVNKVDLSTQPLSWVENDGYSVKEGVYSMVYDGTNTLPSFTVKVPEDCSIIHLLESDVVDTFTTSDFLKFNNDIEIWEKKNFAGVNVGEYKVKYSLDHKWLKGSWIVQYQYTRRDLTLVPKDLEVSYGDLPFGTSNKDFKESVIVEGLVEADEEVFYSSLTLQIKDSEGKVYDGFGTGLPCGNYVLVLGYGNIGISENYNVTIVNGSLSFNKAVINVEFKKVLHPCTMTLNKDTIVYSYKAPYYDLTLLDNEVSENLEIVFIGDDGNFYDFQSLPMEVGVYQISARGEFSNYTLNVTSADLLLYTPILRSGNGEASLKGKFSPLCDAKVVMGSADDDMKDALSIYGNLSVVKVVNIQSDIILLDNETIDSCAMDINVSDIENFEEITVYARKNGNYHKVSFLSANNKITVVLAEGFDGFVICIPTPYDYTWIIILACGAALLVAIVVVLIVLYKKGMFIKGKTKMGEKVQPTMGHVTEDEEFESMIAGFDTSTVSKEKSFAEELEAKKEKELYEQYRLRLERSRQAGDKRIEDMLKAKGITRIDDEAIIRQMIENDRKRAKEIEEQEAREKAEAEAKAEAERRVVVKKSSGDGSYTQKTFAPKKKNNDGDIDI